MNFQLTNFQTKKSSKSLINETLNHLLKIVNCKSKIILTLIIALVFILSVKPVLANMKSADYILQMPNLNFSSGSISNPEGPYKMGFTGGQTAPGEYSSTGYKVLAGFWYLKTIVPFSFTVSNQIIDFGSLTAGVPKYDTTQLTVSAGGAGGYQVTTQENHPLTVYSTGYSIPDTTGDNGDITEETAGVWDQNTTYGFGYTVSGTDAVPPFPSADPADNLYKQFADISKDEEPQVIMASDKVVKAHSATVTYKVNISANQPAGRYHNVIMYIATPTY